MVARAFVGVSEYWKLPREASALGFFFFYKTFEKNVSVHTPPRKLPCTVERLEVA
jgi:hypothetical protein